MSVLISNKCYKAKNISQDELYSFFLSLAKMNYYFLSTLFFSAGVVLCTFDDDLLLQKVFHTCLFCNSPYWMSIKNSNCPTGWIPAESVDMGCLLFAGERRTWLDASLYCRTAARTEDGEALDTYMAEILSYEVGTKVNFGDAQI